MPRKISFATAKRLLRTPVEVRACRVCKCTDTDCSGCVKRTGVRCFWIEADICSACAPTGDVAAIARGTTFIQNVTAFDLMAVAASAQDGHWETEVAFVLDAYFSARRGLASKPHQITPHRFTHADDVRVYAARDFLSGTDVSAARGALTLLLTSPTFTAAEAGAAPYMAFFAPSPKPTHREIYPAHNPPNEKETR